MSIGVRPAGKPIVAFGAAERGFEAAAFPEITGQAGVAHRTVPPVPRRPRAAPLSRPWPGQAERHCDRGNPAASALRAAPRGRCPGSRQQRPVRV